MRSVTIRNKEFSDLVDNDYIRVDGYSSKRAQTCPFCTKYTKVVGHPKEGKNRYNRDGVIYVIDHKECELIKESDLFQALELRE